LIVVLKAGLLAESFRKTVPFMGNPVAATPETIAAGALLPPPPLPQPAMMPTAKIAAAALTLFVIMVHLLRRNLFSYTDVTTIHAKANLFSNPLVSLQLQLRNAIRLQKNGAIPCTSCAGFCTRKNMKVEL
jgi:hypothetical protein